MQGIYLILNKMNQHCYIGQSVDIEDRWRKHRSVAFNEPTNREYQYPLYRAFRKYGLENFEFIVLEELSNATPEELLNREIFWYNVLNNEYNQIHPSKKYDNKQGIFVCQINKKTLKLIKTYSSQKEAARAVNGVSNVIKSVLKKKKLSAYGYYWCYLNELENFKEPKPKNQNYDLWLKRKNLNIAQFDPEYKKIINIFESTHQAANSVGCSGSSIQNAINNNQQFAGYLWQYV